MIRILNGIDQGLMLIAMVTLIAMMMITAISVLGRYFFLSPIPDDVTMNELLLIFVAFLPLSVVQARRDHIMVNVFTEWMQPRSKAVLDTFGLLVGVAIFSFLTWASVESFLHAAKAGAYVDGLLNLSESPSRCALAVGIGILTLRLIVNLLRNLIGIVSDKPDLLGPDVEVPEGDSMEHIVAEVARDEAASRPSEKHKR